MYIVETLRGFMRRRLEAVSCDIRKQLAFVMQCLNRVGSFLGMDVFTPNFSSKNLHLRLLMLNVFVFTLINLYDLYINYGNLVEFMFCFETLMYVGIACIKMSVFLQHQTILKLKNFMQRFYDRFLGDPEQYALLDKSIVNTFTLVVLFSIASASAAILILIYSLVWSMTVDYVLPFGFIIPTIGIEDLRGFVINYCFQVLQTFLHVSGLISSESAFFVFLLNACLQVDMLRLELGRLAKLCADNDEGQHTAEIRTRIRTIIDNHIAHQEFSKSLCGLFELHFFVVFGCSFCQLVSIVVVVVAVPDWYPGYFLFGMLTFQLFCSSVLGQMFDIKCDELTVAIYNVPWYNMEPEDQKAMQLLLIASQNPGCISYGFGAVNMQAFFQIYSKTYSIGMMMISVNEEE